jgi:hypothetical protein
MTISPSHRSVSPSPTSGPNVFTAGANTAASTSGVTVTDNGNGTDTITLNIPQAPETK